MTAPTLPLEVRRNLIGFLVPPEADETQQSDPASNDELDQAAEPAGIDDDDSLRSAGFRLVRKVSERPAPSWSRLVSLGFTEGEKLGRRWGSAGAGFRSHA